MFYVYTEVECGTNRVFYAGVIEIACDDDFVAFAVNNGYYVPDAWDNYENEDGSQRLEYYDDYSTRAEAVKAAAVINRDVFFNSLGYEG